MKAVVQTGEGKGEILLYGNYIRKKEKAFGHSLTMQIVWESAHPIGVSYVFLAQEIPIGWAHS